ncbi:hypothetical protein KP509_32G030900 [Ceratopteris richardii]|uniref:EF-hand domain-containing protein n=1 Tax=Ceratopteris richardii TaxID=49495 RepID=A0A8T2QS53_CERRI|nr:hypothetical protein KP509_32G030900 [Ceratopteris richardii]
MMESHLSADVLDLCSDLWHFQSVVKSFSFRQCRPEENRRLRKSSGHSSSADNQIARGSFRIFDENGDGVVSKHEICRLMEKLGLTAMESGVCSQSLVTGSTSDVRENVDGEQFSVFYNNLRGNVKLQGQPSNLLVDRSNCSIQEDDGDDDLLDAFHVFDKDRDGFICASELQDVLGSLGYSQEACSLETCSEMIARVDRNGDGHVDFFEFTALLQWESYLPTFHFSFLTQDRVR